MGPATAIVCVLVFLWVTAPWVCKTLVVVVVAAPVALLAFLIAVCRIVAAATAADVALIPLPPASTG